MNIGRLKRIMEENNIGVGELAEITGKSKSTIYRRFRGKDEFTAGDIKSIADVLELSESDVLNIFFLK